MDLDYKLLHMKNLGASETTVRCSLLASLCRFEPAFTGDKGVWVSMGGNVDLCLVVGSGDHIPHATYRGAPHSDWQTGIGKWCDRSESRKSILHVLNARHA